MRGMGAFGWALKIKGRSKSKGKGQVNYPTQATEAWMGTRNSNYPTSANDGRYGAPERSRLQ